MADIWERWDTPENTQDRCAACNTSPAHFTEWQACEDEYQRLMDPRLSDRRPSVDLRSRRADLQLALQRRVVCREPHTLLNPPDPAFGEGQAEKLVEIQDLEALDFKQLKALATERGLSFSPVGLSKKKLLGLLRG